MFNSRQFEQIVANLRALGIARIFAMSATAAAIIATVFFGSYYLGAPDYEPLYSDLTQQDVARIGSALGEAGISFDVSSDGTKILVPPHDSARAKMMLAEKGLPANLSNGYELFDKVGSIGLTSFMQDVTKTRALEGELARSIQTLRGVRAARVHIALPERESFRREQKAPSASVVVKLENGADLTSSRAIRYLVSAAIPGMRLENVQVVGTDGSVLASDGEGGADAPNKMLELERTVSKDLRNRIQQTLAPYLGDKSFQVSVSSKINMDKRQTNETAYDPKSRVERSLRIVKQADNSQNTNNNAAVGAEQNIPGEENDQVQGEQSKRSNEKKEEITNYEINTKTTSTESLGYRIEQLNAAVLVDRKRLVEVAGGSPVGGALDSKIKEIEGLVRSAIGAETSRGDQVTVAAVEFIPGAGDIEPVPGRSISEILLGQIGTLIRAATIVGIAAFLVLAGFRPITRILTEQPAAIPVVAGPASNDGQTAIAENAVAQIAAASIEEDPDRGLLDNISRAVTKHPNKRLEKIIDINEEQAAAVLKQWLQQGAAG